MLFLSVNQRVYHFLLGDNTFDFDDIVFTAEDIINKLSEDKFFKRKFTNLSEEQKGMRAKSVFIQICLFVVSMITGCYGSNEGGKIFESSLTRFIDDKKQLQKKAIFYDNWHLEEKVKALRKMFGNSDSEWKDYLKNINKLMNGQTDITNRIQQRIEKVLSSGKRKRGR